MSSNEHIVNGSICFLFSFYSVKATRIFIHPKTVVCLIFYIKKNDIIAFYLTQNVEYSILRVCMDLLWCSSFLLPSYFYFMFWTNFVKAEFWDASFCFDCGEINLIATYPVSKF